MSVFAHCRIMFGRTSWQGRTYADKVASNQPSQQQQQNGSQQPPDYVERGRQIRETNVFLRADRNEKKAREKFLFHQRIRMEEKRSKLAQGNILNFLMEGRNVSDKRVLMNRVLRTAGFGPSDISSIKLNEYRGAQAEVLLKGGVPFDIDEIDRKIKSEGLNVVVSSFDDKEEVLSIFGLPLTTDVEEMKKKILEAIEPFCERVKDIIATSHQKFEEDDFFGGALDGNYKVKVVPARDPVVQIPNFIVVDNDKKVCARAVYTKSLNDKKQMCLNCYSVDHFRDDFECKGPKSWDDYVLEFERAWQEARVVKSNGYGGESEQESESEEGRVARLISDLNKKFCDGEEKIAGLELELGEVKEALEACRNEQAEALDATEDMEEEETVVETEETGVEVAAVGETDKGQGVETKGTTESGVGEAQKPTTSTPEDPLSDLLVWADEVEKSDPEKGAKRVAKSPPVDDRARLKELRLNQSQQLQQLGLKKGGLYEIAVEGGTAQGKFVKLEGSFVYLDTKEGVQGFNIRGRPDRIRPYQRKTSA